MANSETIKSINTKTVRKILNENESISKTDIAKYTGLSFPTVSTVIEYLIETNEVVEVGFKDSLGGRCAKKYSLNPMYACSLLLYLEGRKINWIVNDFCMKKIDSEIVNISGCILEEIDNIVSLVKSRYSQLASIIIGIASNVKDGKLTSKIEYSELQGIDIIKYFSDKYSIPVYIENDMNIAIKGYWERHNNKNIESVVNIYMGDNGIGSSMILGGHVWKGSSNFAGELHYLPICDNNIKYCTSGFEGVNMVEYYGKIVQSYIALINPSLVVIYNNSYISDKLEEIKNYCKNIIPEEVMPKIIISNEFIKDYEYGLSKMAIDLLDY
ncbi:transcriptional regulator [[Clostridium] sordellii]|uniref:ROK family transcriptional regulator n=1 Tax=Paraclostridium sordellii TaxID=1505 RepID=UPI0005E67F85|nr:ROK family protein [Paeniclostridium sordellii]CEN75207.1 transcriptional regulator [[Clostridium] sordellii] [Paeniclostridium sordellii]